MLYNGKQVELTPEQEEVATMFAVMKDTEFAAKPKFIENFMKDWRVILGKEHLIKKFHPCDFTPIYDWHQNEKDKKKQLSAQERKALKEEKLKQEERVEPPGLETNLHGVRKGKAPLQLDADDGKPKKKFTPEMYDRLQKKINLTLDKIEKTQRDMDLKKELKTTALGTSKTNYLDPRISVAWCKRHEVPIEKIFNKSLLAKFAWTMDVDPDSD
ncbi:hypothetical protein C5167_007011 [Papaver somniferum]|uniref:DNA topoisomerase I eukaryotic-type domain-containing protein n=1 Tax=Papaver somniferum TaxID=3469 RepID=A0A4Y7JIE5_PAPSO|nr:hypothetical protein C5167_007011 [Papaver somniferum]